jgi:hypothetical protein
MVRTVPTVAMVSTALTARPVPRVSMVSMA